MECKGIYNLPELIGIRHQIHRNPEIAFEELETVKTIVEYLIKVCHVEKTSIKTEVGITGIVVTIKGKGEERGSSFCIAFRADMDSLPMTDETDLPYKSQNPNKAHSCGHDGHIVCLLGFAALLSENINVIPCNKTIKLIFQPAEEFCRKRNTGGAKLMVEAGCLEQVDEIYGFHNFPAFELGYLAVKEGAIMAGIGVINLKIRGKGGHASTPHLCNNPVDALVYTYLEIEKINLKFTEAKRDFVMCFPLLNAGSADNVIPDTAELKGNIRIFEDGLAEEIVEELNSRLPQVCSRFGCTIEINYVPCYPLVNNHKEQSEVVERIGKIYFKEKIVPKDFLPIRAAEDFSFYLKKVPGCFFLIG